MGIFVCRLEKVITGQYPVNKHANKPSSKTNYAMINNYDVFICHASEDKDGFVKPLADALILKGFEVWYDDYVVRAGHSIRDQINHGLSSCRHGIIVFSKNFFNKSWPRAELNALYHLMMNDPEKRILPIAYDIEVKYLASIDPLIADIKTVKAEIGEDVSKISRLLIQEMISHEMEGRSESRTTYTHSLYSHNYYNPPEDIVKYGYKFEPPYELERLEDCLRPREILICYLKNPTGRGFDSACHITCRERLREFQRDYTTALEFYAVEIQKLQGKFDHPFS